MSKSTKIYSSKMIMEMTEPKAGKEVFMKATVITPYSITEMRGKLKVTKQEHTKAFSNCKIKIEQ